MADTSQDEALLKNRVALITGAGRGLGRAIGIDLARNGARVVLSARSRDEIEAVADEVRGLGGEAIAIPCDVTDEASVLALVDRIQDSFSASPSIVVNNAGAAESHAFVGHPDALWERMIEVNLSGTYRVTRACAQGMLDEGWGRVINIGSVASVTGAPYIAAYTAAKHGVLGLTRALAAEWVRKGITVNLVAPGYVDTPMTDATIERITDRTGRSEDAAREAILSMSPQRRLVHPSEIAPLVRLLASEAGASITGAVLPVDAGASAFASTG